MNTVATDSEPQEPQRGDEQPDEMPVREPDEFADLPTPKRVTREIDARDEPLSDKEDLSHGDEGIDDPPEAGRQPNA